VGVARIVIQLSEDEVVVHEFRRATTRHDAASISKMLRSAMGWLQAYGDQVSNEQWEADIAKAMIHALGE